MPHPQLRLLLERLVHALLAATLIATSGVLGLGLTASLWAIMLVWLVARSATRATGIVFAAITAYGTTAWLAAANGNHYFPPFPPLAIIESTTLLDLRSIMLAFLLSELLFGARRIDRAVREAAAAARTALIALAESPVRHVIVLILLSVGVWDWVSLARIGVGEVLGDARRAHAHALILTTDHNVQFIVVALSIAAGACVFFTPHRWASAIALALCWSPFVLVGSRKELLLTAATLGVLVATSHMRRWMTLIGAIVGFMFLRPVLSTGDFYDALHEFILPQYMHFALQMGLISPDFAGPFVERAQFLVPGPLRLSEPTDMALAFFATGATNVGVGASPFAEAETILPGAPAELVFALLFTALLGLIIATRTKLPFVAVIGFAQMLTIGRSDTWIAYFFVIYSALTLHLLVVLISKRNLRHDRISSHRQHAGSPRSA